MMKQINMVAISLLISLSLFGQQRTNTPNIVVIFMDDMGYGDLPSYGAIGYRTPNLNTLAAQGMRFTNFYTPQATCTASRAALLTGCYPNRVHMYGAFGPRAGVGLHPEEETLADLLKQNGYATGMFGKWHLGNEREFLPIQQGFEEYVGLPYSNDMWPVDYDGKPLPPDHPRAKAYPPLPLLSAKIGANTIDTAMIIEDLSDQAKLTQLYTEKAVDFIKRKQKQPFFLYLAHAMTHVPIAASEKFRGKSQQGLFGDVMMEVDWSVGEIIKTLKSLHLDQNTLVIFTSDNGPWLNYGNHNGNTAGLREGKGTSWEGGTRIPCIMYWPGRIQPGLINNKLSSTIDILPTVAKLTKSPLPKRTIDGVDISAILFGQEKDPRMEFYYYYNKNDLEAVRKGWWKLVFPHRYRSYEGVQPGNDGYPGPYANGNLDSLALYDLRRDPGERYNVIDNNPEIVKELKLLAEKARADLGDDLTQRKGTNRRPIGSLK